MAIPPIPILVSSSPLTARRVIAATLVSLAVLLGFLLLYRFRTVVLIVFTGIVVSIAISPGVNWLHGHRLPRALSIILIYLILAILLALFIYLIVPQFVQQMTSLIPTLEKDYLNLRSTLFGSDSPLLRQIAVQLPGSLTLFSTTTPAAGSGGSVAQALNIAAATFSALFILTAILLIGFYWTLESERALRSLLLWVPNEQRERVHEVLEQIETRLGGYVRGQFFLAGSLSLAALIVVVAIGLPSALPVALLAGVLSMVPLFGSTLAVIPAVLVSLASDPSKTVWVIVLFALLQFLENNLLVPHVMRKTVGVNPVITLLAIVAFGSLFGFAGLMLAIPMAAVVQILLERSLLHRWPDRRDACRPRSVSSFAL
jgi:predicted PurR-regulated permease PerM